MNYQPIQQPQPHVFAPTHANPKACYWCGGIWGLPVHSAAMAGSTVTRKPANHLLHLVLTILTGGLWLPIWILCAVNGRNEVTRRF